MCHISHATVVSGSVHLTAATFASKSTTQSPDPKGIDVWQSLRRRTLQEPGNGSQKNSSSVNSVQARLNVNRSMKYIQLNSESARLLLTRRSVGLRSGSCDDDLVAPAPTVDTDRLALWCTEHLGSAPVTELFRSGHLSAVVGLALTDGRQVVVKIRSDSPRIAACVDVQRRLFEAGYPCPEPLTDAAPFDGAVATAETYVAGGAMLPSGPRPTEAFAAAFALLIESAPAPAEVASLAPAPSWAAWNHTERGIWPAPEDLDVDLNEVVGPQWLDDAGRWARDRLRSATTETVIGHCDWLAGNLRWTADGLLVVHDWDSLVADSEAVLVGFAAALHSTVSADTLATIEDSERFLAAYCRARGRELTSDERERSWAAGVWTRAYDAKYQHAVGARVSSLSESEAAQRLRRAGRR